MAGKGSRARPLSVSRSQFSNNWDAIFGKASDDAKNVAKSEDRTETVLRNTNTSGILSFEDWKIKYPHQMTNAALHDLNSTDGIEIAKAVDTVLKSQYDIYVAEYLKQRLA